MRDFLLIAAAALGSSIAGGIFGTLIGLLSPELIRFLAMPQPVLEPVQFAAATGLIAGLFIGAAAMGFGLLVAVLRARRSAIPAETTTSYDAFEPSSPSRRPTA